MSGLQDVKNLVDQLSTYESHVPFVGLIILAIVMAIHMSKIKKSNYAWILITFIIIMATITTSLSTYVHYKLKNKDKCKKVRIINIFEIGFAVVTFLATLFINIILWINISKTKKIINPIFPYIYTSALFVFIFAMYFFCKSLYHQETDKKNIYRKGKLEYQLIVDIYHLKWHVVGFFYFYLSFIMSLILFDAYFDNKKIII